MTLVACDVFAGGGGLSVGLKEAGFQIAAAVELESHAFATYKANHPEVKAYLQDVRLITGKDLASASPSGKIDLLAGCPPCQGFCSLTAKYKRTDERNSLVLEIGRLVQELQPLAVMMENVPGLAKQGGELFQALVQQLKGLGYKVDWRVLQVADYGVPQSRRRFVLFAGRGFSIPFPDRTHSRTGSDGLPKWKTVRDAIDGRSPAVTLRVASANGGPQAFDWHVVRDMSERNRARLSHATPGGSRMKLPSRLKPVCHRGKYGGFSNVYGRMAWDREAPTITGGCTTLSKGRFGHPSDERTISVREAALLQTFPPAYIIDTPYMDYACDIVGNALPCAFAAILAKQCYATIASFQGAPKMVDGASCVSPEKSQKRKRGDYVGT